MSETQIANELLHGNLCGSQHFLFEHCTEKCFLSSQTWWSWQDKRACTSFWTCSSSPGHWSHTQEPSSSHAAASTFKVSARKRNLLILRVTCLDRSRWRYRGTLIGIRSYLEKGMANQKWYVASLLLCVLGSTNSASLQTPLILCFKSAVHCCYYQGNSMPSLNSSYIQLTPTQSLKSAQQLSCPAGTWTRL